MPPLIGHKHTVEGKRGLLVVVPLFGWIQSTHPITRLEVNICRSESDDCEIEKWNIMQNAVSIKYINQKFVLIKHKKSAKT